METKDKNILRYPRCKKTDWSEEYFGRSLCDPYRWLKDPKSQEVLEWVKEENEYTNAWFDKDEVSAKIQELKRKQIKPVYQEISKWRDGYAATRVEEGECKIFWLDQNLKKKTLLFERSTIAGYTPDAISPCPADHNLIIVLGLYDGDARPTMLVVDCAAKKILAEIGECFSCVWSENKPLLYYSQTVSDATSQVSHSTVWVYHADTDKRECIFEDKNDSILGMVHASSDKCYIMMEMVEDYSHSKFYAYEEVSGKITDLSRGIAAEMKYVDSMKDRHYFISQEKAPFGQVISIGGEASDFDTVVIRPETKEVLESGFIVNGKLFITMLSAACSKIVGFDKGKETEVELPGRMGAVSLAGLTEGEVFLRYESFVKPPSLLTFDGENIRTVYGEREGEHSHIIVEQKYAPSKGDKKPVPYFMVHRKGVEANGDNPVWIYAYGGYNAAMQPGIHEPVTRLKIADWVEKGGIYILANIRGGSEFGSNWHLEGMGMNKKNCFYDFIGVTEQVISERWTRPEKIAVSGGSNGGLLMSALLTMRPDLFGCVIASVPHTDMIHFAEDDRGPMYITEYGNPKESREMFEYLLSYSPYHNVKKVHYPAAYIQTGECDNNVPPYHGKKFAARLQEENQSHNPILLRVLKEGSHDRGRGEVYWETIAQMQLFVEKALGI